MAVNKLIFSLLAAFFIGYVPVYFLLEYKKEHWKEQIFIFFLSIYFGFFLISDYLILLSLLNIKFSFLNAVVFSLIFCAAFIFIRIFKFKKAKQARAKLHHYDIVDNRKGSGNRHNSGTGVNRDFGYNCSHKGLKLLSECTEDETVQKNTTGNLKVDECNLKERSGNQKENEGGQRGKIGKLFLVFQAIFAFLMFINFCAVTFFTFLFPIRFWDAISCWSLKGCAFFLDGTVTAFYTQHQYTFAHLTYPLYISLSQTWIYIWLGEINETLVKAVFPLFYLSLTFIFYYLLRKEIKRLYAIISVFILSTLPVIMDHGYLEYTNLVFSVILLLGVYYFYVYILKIREFKNQNTLPNRNFQDRKAQSSQTQFAQDRIFQNLYYQNQASLSQTPQGQSYQSQKAQNPDRLGQAFQAGQNIRENLKNLIICAVFFAILVSIRSEGILFLVIFLIINTAYNLSILPGSLSRKKNCPIADEGKLIDGSRSLEHIKTAKSDIGVSDRDSCKTSPIKLIKSSKRRNIILYTAVSILLPVVLFFLLLAPWTVLQVKLNISGASTEWVPVIAGLKNGLKNILNGSLLLPGGSSEISSLFSFKNASGAFLGEFLFSKFDSAKAFLGSSYGIVWVVLAVMAVFNLKKLFKSFNWIFFIFLSAGFIALFISLGFIPEFAWSTERYMLHLFPLAYFWIIRPYLSNTVLLRSLAPEK